MFQNKFILYLVKEHTVYLSQNSPPQHKGGEGKFYLSISKKLRQFHRITMQPIFLMMTVCLVILRDFGSAHGHLRAFLETKGTWCQKMEASYGCVRN